MPGRGGDQPATRADVRALELSKRADLHAMEEGMERRLQELKNEIEAGIEVRMERALARQTESLQEFVRDNQTELLRGFQVWATGFDTRLGKVNAELSIWIRQPSAA